MKRILGYLLFLANSTNIYANKNNFYELKKRILYEKGALIDKDFQHIKKECWTCGGIGIFNPTGEMCFRCGGSGVYSEFIVILHKFRIGKVILHVPYEKVEYYQPGFSNLEKIVNIHGLIKHRIKHKMAGREAALWLMLIFNGNIFKKEFGSITTTKPPHYPLCFIEWVYFKVKHEKIKLFSTKTNKNIDLNNLPF